MSETWGPGRRSGALPGTLVGVCAILLVGCGAALVSPRGTALPVVTDSPAGMARVGALLFVALGLVVLAWWLFSLAVAVLAVLLARRGHRRAAARVARWSPAFMRRLAAALLGAHLLLVPAAHAVGPDAPAASVGSSGVASVAAAAAGMDLPTASWASRDLPSPAWRPERPAPPMNRLMGQQNRAAADDGGVVVCPGDSLWSIAARVAGPGVSDAEVAREWPRWYRANRSVIGPDPDLLHIGTVLTPPRAE